MDWGFGEMEQRHIIAALHHLPESLTIAMCSVLGIRLTTRFGARSTMIIGMSALILSMLLLAQISTTDG